MLDLRLLRQDPEGVERRLRTKEAGCALAPIMALDEETRVLTTRLQALQAELNARSKEVGLAKREGRDVAALLGAMGALSEEVGALEGRLRDVEGRRDEALSHLPNLPCEDVPVADGPEGNVMVRSWGEKRAFDFAPKHHLELDERLGLFDFKRSAKTSGAGWPAYRGMGARLEWALLNYMLDYHVARGFTQWMPPLLVRPEMMYASGQLPKFGSQMFQLRDDDFHLYLIPTAEIVLNGLHQGEILEEVELPLKYVSYTPCFRREAGAAGSQERGLIRMHQFNKVEMFAFCRPEDSWKLFDEMWASAEGILQGLGMHYRSMLLSTGDMSYCSAKTIDVEVWLPGQNRYYEVSSVSNCTDFQARRSGTRFRRGGQKPELLHTLNGSGLATSRLMVAILENNQQADGSVVVPKVLQEYLGVERLTPCQ